MKKYNGILVPMITPFTKDGKIDHYHLEKIIQSIITSGCHPFVLGTTGEGLSISDKDKAEVIATLVKFKSKGSILYASVSDVSYHNMLERAKKYAGQGVDVVVAHLPPHYHLSSSAMLNWFEGLAEESPCPVMLYNIPATTHMSIPLEVADHLSRHENIVGLKDSERDEERLKKAVSLWKDRLDFSHFIGWAARSYEALKLGSDGLVPSSANIFPLVYCRLYEAVKQGNDADARKWQQVSDELGDLYQQGRLLPDSLAALKVILHALYLCKPFVLPPLYRLNKKEEENILKQFTDYHSDLKHQLNP